MADLGFDPLMSTVQGRRLENLPPLAVVTPLPEGGPLRGFYTLGRQAIHFAIRVPSGRLFNVWIQ